MAGPLLCHAITYIQIRLHLNLKSSERTVRDGPDPARLLMPDRSFFRRLCGVHGDTYAQLQQVLRGRCVAIAYI